MSLENSALSFWDHLEELRQTLIRSLILVACSSLIAFCFYDQVIEFVTLPLQYMDSELQGSSSIKKHVWIYESLENTSNASMELRLPKGARLVEGANAEKKRQVVLAPGETIEYKHPKKVQNLAVFSPTEGISVALKVSAWVGLVVSSPLCLFLLLRFLAPGLQSSEKKLILPFLALSCLFVACGILFAAKLTIPFANRFLYSFNAEIGENFWSLSHYVSFTLTLALANGLAFECVVLLLFLVHMGVVSAEALINKRRHAVVGICILSAILTPPDVITQIFLAVPLIGFYEMTILYARLYTPRLNAEAC